MVSTNHIYSQPYIRCDTKKCHLERQVLTPLYYGIVETVGVINFYLYCNESKQNSKSHLASYWLFRAMKPLQKAWVHISGMIKVLTKWLHSRNYWTIKTTKINECLVLNLQKNKNGSLLVFFDCLLISHDMGKSPMWHSSDKFHWSMFSLLQISKAKSCMWSS